MKKAILSLPLLVLLACSHASSSSEETVSATAAAVTISGHATITSISGTYAGCKTHADGDHWSVSAGGALPYPALSVRQHDTSCQLTITQANDASNAYSSVGFGAGPQVLTTSYAAASPEFRTGPSNMLGFYGNAEASDLSFHADFQITFLVSDSAQATSQNKGAGHATVTATALVSTVPAPNYTLDLSAFDFASDVNDVVTSTTGTVAVNAGSQTGEDMAVLDDGNTDPTSGLDFDTVAALYNATPRIPIPSSLSGADLGLVGRTLPDSVTLIIAHAQSDVRSFEVLTINFQP